MASVYEIKEHEVTDVPLLLFDCELMSGVVEHWSTHAVNVGGTEYSARVLRHNLFEMQSGGMDGIDGISKVSLTLANSDSHFSEAERGTGWKGARLTVRFLFYALKDNAPASDVQVIFLGAANPPEEIAETTCRLSFLNRMSLQRVALPQVRIQKRCPWMFPQDAASRQLGIDGGVEGKYSPFTKCGYSAGIPDGVGNLSGAAPFGACDYTKAQCQARGMYDHDSAGNTTARFGGLQFVPPSILVRSYGESGSHLATTFENAARYNDVVPLVYGTAWYQPPIVFARNDGNLTHMEVLLGEGGVAGVVMLLVNDIEIPPGRSGANLTATGWYNPVTGGGRSGAFSLDFRDAAGNPLGDPHGSLSTISVVVPNRISDGNSLPKITVLLQGLKLPRFNDEGSVADEAFTNNPAWVLLDILRRSGWSANELDFVSFAQAAAHCDETVQAVDLYGNPISVPRYQCNLVLSKRRSASDVARGIRNASGLFFRYGAGGQLQLRVEGALAVQQPTKPEGSNSTETLNGGWPAYEFGDGSTEFSGILRKANDEPRIRLTSKGIADSPNRFTVEFQDQFNEFQQDSLSLVDPDDALASGQEISVSAAALGIANFDQAGRVLQLMLNKSVHGNTYVELETSVRALASRPGDLITVTYLKEGFLRQAFRILRISPGTNYETALIVAQIHDDAWYGTSGASGGGRRQPRAAVGLPRPLGGATLDADGDPQFDIHEEEASGDTIPVAVGFTAPANPSLTGIGIPLVSLSAAVSTTGGILLGGTTYYYALSGVDEGGVASALSFLVRASTPPDSSTNSVTLCGLSFSAGTRGFHVYRGKNPAQLYRVAANVPLAPEYQDTGEVADLASPPDENYDHANFYWRLERVPETNAQIFSSTTIGSPTLQLQANEQRGKTIRITKGLGRGEERPVVANTQKTLTVAPPWDPVPDATSVFVVAESGWHFGALGYASPIELSIPNRAGATVHISGRSANVLNAESAYELSPLTRWDIAGGNGDGGVPGTPMFGLAPGVNGTVELLGLGFEDFVNTRTITGGTLTLWYWDELMAVPNTRLSSAVNDSDTTLQLTAPGAALAGDCIQLENEVLEVTEVLDNGGAFVVKRGSHGSAAASHDEQSTVYCLTRSVSIVPFVNDFFGSPASGSFAYSIFLPNVRLVAAEWFVTNTFGNSPTHSKSFTNTVDAGFRTLSGGQFSMQIEGVVAIETDAVPTVVVDETCSIRDVFAVVRTAPAGGPLQLSVKKDGVVFASLTIADGATISTAVDGRQLSPLASGAHLGLNVTAVGLTEPGRDLTVTIRL